MTEPRILIWDIETAPGIAYFWGKKWDARIPRIIQHGYLLSVSYRWVGDDEVHFIRKAKGRTDNDKALTLAIWRLLDEADAAIAHNGDKFDMKEVHTRFLKHGLGAPSPTIQIDTLKIARQNFNLPSNRLNDLAVFLGLEGKASNTGFDTWLGCMNDDPQAWDIMENYNKQDIVVLENVYYALRPYMNLPGKTGNKFNAQQWYGYYTCTNCGSPNTRVRKEYRTRAGWRHATQCQDCGGWATFKRANVDDDTGEYR
jgi:hypothetical protein